MLRSVQHKKLAPEGYVYISYGAAKYLKHAVASVISLRRYDKERPVALICEERHKKTLESQNLTDIFDVIHIIAPKRASILGFKHNNH